MSLAIMQEFICQLYTQFYIICEIQQGKRLSDYLGIQGLPHVLDRGL